MLYYHFQIKRRLFAVLPVVLFLFLNCSADKSRKVALQPYAGFSPALCDTLAAALEKEYGVQTFVLKPKALPQEAFVHIKSPRYRADKLIEILKKEKPDSLEFVLGLTNLDISCTKKDAQGKVKEPQSKYYDWGVFGLGYRPGPTCVISTFRLAHATKSVFTARLKKVALHELGHNFGLKHCDSEECVMQDAAETIKTIDRVKPALCPKCRKQIG